MGPRSRASATPRCTYECAPSESRRAISALLLAMSLGVPGCEPRVPERASGGTDSIVVVDQTGARLALPHPAERIVSLVPSVTETLHAIGASTALVGRTDFDQQPWASTLPSVGGGLEPSLEEIVALEPDLVVRFGGSQDPRTRDRLDELGIRYITVRPDGLEDVFVIATLLGRVTGREGHADSLVSALRAGLEETAEAVRSWPRLRAAHILGGTPPWVTGGGTYIDQILSLVGAENVFSDLGVLYAAVSPEELLRREIDVVLVSSRGQFDAALAPDSRVVEIGDALEIPGPGVVAAARRVAELIHGRSLR